MENSEPAQLNDAISDLTGYHDVARLDEADLDPDPLVQFERWMKDALDAGVHLPNAMALATAGDDGRPSARMVLLKSFGEDGFTFFTNYGSRKARDLFANPYASLVFYWPALERQVCISGDVQKESFEESEAYWKTRPFGSRLSAWASPQSEVITNRDALEASFTELEERYRGGDVPLPPHWGGFRLTPDAMEFWQGRPNRLHDRLRYVRVPGVGWMIERLAP
jgi:pyridoxamine 5'-phosphate oxidase